VFSPIKLEGTVFVTNQEKTDLVAETFSNVYHTQKYGLNSVTEQTVASSVESFRLAEVELVPKFLTSPTEVRNAVRELHLTEATEPDLIDNKLLRHLPRKAIVYLTHLFHACLKLSYFPIAWKCASVIPIFKPGKDPMAPKINRPISLLSPVGKLFESLILHHLKYHINASGIYRNEQFWIPRKAFNDPSAVGSCEASGLRTKLSIGLLLLDVEKAFDCVWHGALLHKMLNVNFPMIWIKIIMSFLSGKTFFVTISGVAQGAVLLSKLFNIFTQLYSLMTRPFSLPILTWM
jgi:hypothetical protein